VDEHAWPAALYRGLKSALGGTTALEVPRIPDLQYSSASPLHLHGCLYGRGAVLLRSAVPEGLVRQYGRALRTIYQRHGRGAGPSSDDIATGNVPSHVFEDCCPGLSVKDLFQDAGLALALKAALGHASTVSGMFTSVAASEPYSNHGIGFHADGVIEDPARFTVNAWAPLDYAEPDGARFCVVLAPLEKVLAYLREHFQPLELPGWHSPTKWAQVSKAFRRDTLLQHFGEGSLWTPELRPGDLLLASNWTIYASQAGAAKGRATSYGLLKVQASGPVINAWLRRPRGITVS
jgi:hypothetical protein